HGRTAGWRRPCRAGELLDAGEMARRPAHGIDLRDAARDHIHAPATPAAAKLVRLSQKVAIGPLVESDIEGDSHQPKRAEMGLPGAKSSESRFARYVEGIASVIGHADRARPLRDYCVGLVMPSERKSVEPMAAVTAPERVGAQH